MAGSRALGRRVRLWRADAGLSQRVAAEQAGMSPTTWRKIEAGEAVRDSVLARVASAMRVPPAHLLRLAEEDAGAESPGPTVEAPAWRATATAALEHVPDHLGPAIATILAALAAEQRSDDAAVDRRPYP